MEEQRRQRKGARTEELEMGKWRWSLKLVRQKEGRSKNQSEQDP